MSLFNRIKSIKITDGFNLIFLGIILLIVYQAYWKNHELIGKNIDNNLRFTPLKIHNNNEFLPLDSIGLESYHGKILVLDFWAPWCGPCRQEMPELEKLFKKHSDKMVVLGVLTDPNLPSAARTIEHLNIHYPQSIDDLGQLSRFFKVSSIPTIVVIDQEGKIRYYNSGYTSLATLEQVIEKM